MTTPTTLPEALTEIEELRGQVRGLLQLLGQEGGPDQETPGEPIAGAIANSPSAAGATRETWTAVEQAQADQDQTQIVGITGVGRDVSEKKRIEAELRRQRQHLLAAQAMAHVGSWDWDIVSGEMEWSDEQFRILGYEPGMIPPVYDTFLSALFPDDHDRVRIAFNEAVKGGGVLDIECRIVRPSGEIRAIHCRGEVTRGLAGYPAHMAGSTVDVTNRKQIEESLRASEQFNKMVLDSLPAHVAVLDRKGTILTVNRAWEKFALENSPLGVFGLANGVNYLDACRIASNDNPKVQQTLQGITDVLSGEQDYFETEYPCDSPSESRWFAMRVTPLAGRNGGAVVVHENITERKRIDAALRSNQERLALVLAATNDGVWDWNLLTGDAYLSPQWKALLGFQDHELANNEGAFFQRLHRDDADQVQAALEAHFKSNAPYDLELRLRHRNGHYHWFRTRGEAIRDSEGRPSRMVGTIIDIEHRKRMELQERERLSRMIRFQEVQLQLDRLPHQNLAEDFQSITKLASQALEVERVGIWLFTDDHSTLVCRELYRLSLDQHERGASLKLMDYPLYADSLERDLPLAATDALNDPRTNEFAASYLEPLGVASRMDAAVRRHGKVIGAVFFEQIGASRNWSSEEQTFAASIADHVTLCLAGDERRRAERALAESEHRLRAVLETLPVGVWFTDAEGIVQFSNPASQRIWGGASSIILSRPGTEEQWEEAVAEGVPHRWVFTGALANGTSPVHERLLIRCSDGATKVINNTAVRVHDDTGKKVGLIVVNEDVTAQIQMAEREAARSEQLKRLSELSLTLSGDPSVIFGRVVRMIGELFKVRVVCLSEIIGQELHFKAVCVNDQVTLDAGRCPLAVTPCSTVKVDKDLRLFDQVIERFPQASFLRDHKAVSYCGFPSLDSHGQVVAVTCLLDDKPHEFTDEDQKLLRVFGQRIALEMERASFIAKQRQQTDELQQSHAFIHQIIDTVPDFIFAKDRSGRFILANQATAEAYGTTAENLIGKTDADFNPNSEEVEFFREKDLEVMNSQKERFILEEPITDARGQLRWLQTVKRPIFDKQGVASMVLGVSTDITERKQVEQRLRNSEERFRAFVMASSDVIYRMSPDWSEMRQFKGHDFIVDTETPRRTWLQKYIHPDDQARVMEAVRKAMPTKKIFELEHRTLHVDGSVRWTFSRVVPMLDAEGGIIEWIGAANDVTARNRAEAERQKFVSLADHSVEFIGMCDLDFKPFYVNEAGCRLVGLDSMEQACSARIQDFFFPEDRDYITTKFFPKVLREGRNEVEIRFRHFKTGAMIWMIYNVFQVHDEANQLVGYATVSRDITARKRAEESLRQREQDLQQALEERERISQDLHDGILQSLYATGLVLESCKPLLAQQDHRSSANGNLSSRVSQAIGQLNHVMAEVRNFIAGLESQILQGGDFAEALRTMVRAVNSSQNTKCSVTVDEAAARRISTEQALHLLNMTREALSNSLRHGNATLISVSLKDFPDSVQLVVSDNGIGFDPTAVRGIGYGLANMAARAQKISGRLEVRSKPALGTSINIDLPMET